MRKTYKFLKLFTLIILAELALIALFGTVAFSFITKDSATVTLRFPHIITVIFYLLIIATVATAVYACVRSKNVGITHIKKNNRFLQFASCFAAIMMLVFFVYECVVIASDTTGTNAASHTLYFVSRSVRWILSLVSCIYFVLQALPKRFRHLRIRIPKWLSVTSAICAILWAVVGLIVVYFDYKVGNSETAKVGQLLAYASIAIFLLFESEFELAKPRTKAYMISAFVCSAITFAFPLSISVAKIIGKISVYRAFSQAELLLTFAVGLYALAKMFALVSTMHTVIETSNHSSHSSKFDKPAESSETVKAEDKQ